MATLGNTTATKITVLNDIEAGSVKKTGGTSAQFLKADGSVDANSYSLSNHTHTTALVAGTSSETSTITLAHSTKYKLTAGGTSVIFTTPGDNNTDTWRAIQVDGTQILGTGTNTGVLNLKAGDNITLTNSSGTVTIKATDTNTHYTSKNIVGASATATANATATNGNVYLNHLEESTVKSYHKIVGTGATTVTSDSSGNITINSTDTNTTYSAGTGLSLSGTTFNHSNSVTAVTTAGFLKVKYDAQGHITGSSAVTQSDITALNIPGINLNNHFTGHNTVDSAQIGNLVITGGISGIENYIIQVVDAHYDNYDNTSF